MTGRFGDYATAMEFRDTIDRMVQESVNQSHPDATYAQVVSINAVDRSCMVIMTGDTTSVRVVCGSLMPSAINQIVRIEGPPGARYVADILGDTSNDALTATRAPINAPAFTGNPTASATPTLNAHLTNKSYVDTQMASRAPLASPQFTGWPVSPNLPANVNDLVNKNYADKNYCSLWRNGTQSINHNQWTQVTINATTDDVRRSGQSAQLVSGGITIRDAGAYLINASARFAPNATGTRLMSIDVTGFGGVAADHGAAISGLSVILQTFFVRTFVVNDRITMHVHQNSGGALNIESGVHTRLEAVQIRG